MPVNYGPPTDPEVRADLQRQLDEEYARIDAEIAACPNCKIAKTFARKSNQKLGKGISAADARRKIERAACKRHDHAHHLAYVTSPLSETYWCS
jgi:hypothetical protein